jgi:plastocyanin
MPLATSPYARRGVVPKPRSPAPETKNVIVYVEGTKPATPPVPMRARISQRDEQFLPQVTAITVGSTVDFPNDDPFFHNVFSLSKARTFDLGRYPTGKSRSVTFATPGVVKVFCDIHSHMTALVMVFDHPWFAIPDEEGAFTLPQVPSGELTVVAWHERIGERREQITLAPRGVAKLSFTLPVLENTP